MMSWVGTHVALSTCFFQAFFSSTLTNSDGVCSPPWHSCLGPKSPNSPSVCVHQRQICNGIPDCPLADDEDQETCVDKEGDDKHIGVLLNRTIVKAEEITKCSLSTPPLKCKCTLSTKISCQNAGFERLPDEIDPKTKQLLLGSNNLKLDSSSFERFSNLLRLDLHKNNLKKLPPGVFQNQQNMKQLFLSHNSLSELSCEVLKGLTRLESLILINNTLTDYDPLLQCLPSITELVLDYNLIRLNKRKFIINSDLQILFLENNLIEYLAPFSFEGLYQLTSLYLRQNKIGFIYPNTFANLTKLTILDLNYNKLKILEKDTLEGLSSLSSLEISFNRIDSNQDDVFSGLSSLNSQQLEGMELNERLLLNISIINVSYIYFKRFRYCSYLSHIRDCRPKTDGVSSFSELLVHQELRVGVWIVAVVTLIGNVIVFGGRFFTRDDKVVSLFIRNLAAADFLTGTYLLIIATTDMSYRGNYNSFAYDWMTSWQCVLTGALALVSSEVSVLLLTVMSLERWVCISWPLKPHRLTVMEARIVLTTLWTTGILVSVLPVALYRQGFGFYGYNGMCFPIHLDDPWVPGWQYSAAVFLGLNQIGVVVILVSYLSMFASIRRTRASTPMSVGDREFALRFFFIVFTDCLCWIPIIILKIMALFNKNINPEVYAFVVVILLPINSALNPWLYTFTTPKFRSAVRKSIFGWFYLKRNGRRSVITESETSRTTSVKCIMPKMHPISDKELCPLVQPCHDQGIPEDDFDKTNALITLSTSDESASHPVYSDVIDLEYSFNYKSESGLAEYDEEQV